MKMKTQNWGDRGMTKKQEKTEYFARSQEAKTYYEKLVKKSRTGKFDTYFDFYYLCAMVGFSEAIIASDADVKGKKEFVRDFPTANKPHKYTLICALVGAELKRQGIDMKDRSSVRAEMTTLIDENAQTKLSREGLNLLDRYAEGGFQKIFNTIGVVDELDVFMGRYYKKFILENAQ